MSGLFEDFIKSKNKLKEINMKRPQNRAVLDDCDDGIQEIKTNDVKLVLRWGADYIKPFAVIVECFDHKNYGRGKRLYNAKFSEKERRLIASYYSKLYDWFMRRGIPINGVEMSGATYDLLTRAANFFASI